MLDYFKFSSTRPNKCDAYSLNKSILWNRTFGPILAKIYTFVSNKSILLIFLIGTIFPDAPFLADISEVLSFDSPRTLSLFKKATRQIIYSRFSTFRLG